MSGQWEGMVFRCRICKHIRGYPNSCERQPCGYKNKFQNFQFDGERLNQSLLQNCSICGVAPNVYHVTAELVTPICTKCLDYLRTLEGSKNF